MHRIRKAGAVLRDHYRSMSVREFAGFVQRSLFKDERIWIYCKSLQVGDSGPPVDYGTPIVKGEPADLQSARRGLSQIPWELRCDLYDGVTDFFVYRENGRLGHISWLYYQNDPNRILRLADRECEIKFCLTLQEFRGKGLYPAALRAIQRYLQIRGYQRCFVCVKPDNTASVRGIEKAGFRRAGSVRVRKAFGLQISPRCPTRNLQDGMPA